MTGLLFFKAALAAYLISTLGYITSLLIRRILIAKASTWILLTAFVLHAAFYLVQFIQTHTLPFSQTHQTFSFFAWILSGIYLILQLNTKTRMLGALVSPVALLLMITASAGLEGPVTIPEVMKGNLVAMHILLAMAGEALFALASFAGAMYLIQNRLIKRKSIGSLSRFLPSLKDLDRINHIGLFWGFPLLTLGILSGSIWARTVWGAHWQWDPKQTWTLTTWLLYALLLHQRLAIGWKGRRAALFSLLAFLILLIGLILEKTFFTTIHNIL